MSTSKLQRKLLLSHGGIISEVPVRATDTSGITTDFTTYPPTAGQLPAYWRSGYFGNDSPEQSKLFRWTRAIPDRGQASYTAQMRIVDDTNTVDQPRLVGPLAETRQRIPINQRGVRCSVEIDFPQADEPMNVLELQLAYIATSER